ncbi:hypothetical protein ACFE04_021087 [Oxalis oulophora]
MSKLNVFAFYGACIAGGIGAGNCSKFIAIRKSKRMMHCQRNRANMIYQRMITNVTRIQLNVIDLYSSTKRDFKKARSMGLGDLDFSAIFEAMKRHALTTKASKPLSPKLYVTPVNQEDSGSVVNVPQPSSGPLHVPKIAHLYAHVPTPPPPG